MSDDSGVLLQSWVESDMKRFAFGDLLTVDNEGFWSYMPAGPFVFLGRVKQAEAGRGPFMLLMADFSIGWYHHMRLAKKI